MNESLSSFATNDSSMHIFEIVVEDSLEEIRLKENEALLLTATQQIQMIHRLQVKQMVLLNLQLKGKVKKLLLQKQPLLRALFIWNPANLATCKRRSKLKMKIQQVNTDLGNESES